MRRLCLILVLIIGLQGLLSAQATHVSTSATLPSSCRVGDVYYKTGSSAGFYACTATNTWTNIPTVPVTIANGGTGAAPGSDDQVLVSTSTTAGAWKTLTDCAGTNQGVTYTASTNTWGCNTISGVGGGGAPDNAQYWTGAADGTLSAEKNLGALSTGLVINTAGVPSAYGGSSCSPGSQVTAIDASGAVACSTGTTVGSGAFSEVIAASNQDVTSNTTIANDSELFFTMAAGGIYIFECYLAYNSPAGGGTPDFKFAFNGPATLTGEYTIEGYFTTADAQSGAPASGGLTTPSSIGTATTARIVVLRGWASSSAGGTGSSGFVLQWAQDSSSVNASRRLTGSILRYRRIN